MSKRPTSDDPDSPVLGSSPEDQNPEEDSMAAKAKAAAKPASETGSIKVTR
jgi:hypothetical protein